MDLLRILRLSVVWINLILLCGFVGSASGETLELEIDKIYPLIETLLDNKKDNIKNWSYELPEEMVYPFSTPPGGPRNTSGLIGEVVSLKKEGEDVDLTVVRNSIPCFLQIVDFADSFYLFSLYLAHERLEFDTLNYSTPHVLLDALLNSPERPVPWLNPEIVTDLKKVLNYVYPFPSKGQQRRWMSIENSNKFLFIAKSDNDLRAKITKNQLTMTQNEFWHIYPTRNSYIHHYDAIFEVSKYNELKSVRFINTTYDFDATCSFESFLM